MDTALVFFIARMGNYSEWWRLMSSITPTIWLVLVIGLPISISVRETRREAITALVEFCFAKLQVSRIAIVCDPANLASQKLIERCHAKRESIARHRFLFHGEPRDGVVYSLIPSDLI